MLFRAMIVLTLNCQIAKHINTIGEKVQIFWVLMVMLTVLLSMVFSVGDGRSAQIFFSFLDKRKPNNCSQIRYPQNIRRNKRDILVATWKL